VKSCTDIVISDLTVPPGVTLDLNLTRGSTVTFTGQTLFEFVNWSGPLIRVKGQAVTVQGAEGSLLNGQGELYWDHIGDKGPKKPQFIKIEVSEGSVFRDIHILNCPHHCIFIGSSDNITITRWIIDNSYGDHDNFTGHNTDGFDVMNTRNLIIENSTVINQDDCIAVRSGANVLIQNMYCAGGHGISISVGFSYNDTSLNTLENMLVRDSVVVRSANGIHVKTHADAADGWMRNITYENIQLSGIQNYGINVQQDYVNGSASGIAKDNIPISNLSLINITGNIVDTESKDSMQVYIKCAEEGCKDWEWSGINLQGGAKSSICTYEPEGFTCSAASQFFVQSAFGYIVFSIFYKLLI